MEASRVTVLLPVFNGEEFLSQAIESILEQSFRDFRLLVINDGSTDSSGKIIETFRVRDSRILHLRQENQGLIKTLNRGLAESRTELIARQDADDISLPDRLQKQVEFLDRNPDHAMVGTSFAVRSAGQEDRALSFPLTHEQLVEGLLFGNRFAHGSVMFRREAMLASGGYSDSPDALYIEDYEAWARLAQRHKVANLPDLLYFYRDHPEGISNLKREAQIRNRDLLIQRLQDPAWFLKFRQVPGYRISGLAHWSASDHIKIARKKDTSQILWESAKLMKRLGRNGDAFVRLAAAQALDPSILIARLFKKLSR